MILFEAINIKTRVLMNTYPCAELRAKHDYSSITATLTLQLVHRQLQINIDDSIIIATIMH